MRKKSIKIRIGAALAVWMLSSPLPATPWVPIQGQVRLADGTPVCAMVLANGQYLFSCDGTGAYALDVPVDDSGRITLFAFADGFAPFGTTADPVQFPLNIEMRIAPPTSPEIAAAGGVACLDTPDQVQVEGAVTGGDQPLCAMILANGQQQFSCGETLGTYDLTVPLDADGAVTLFAFADGFQPYRVRFAPDCASEGRARIEQLIGTWDFSYRIVASFGNRYVFTGPAFEAIADADTPGTFYLFGTDEQNEVVTAGWSAAAGQYVALDYYYSLEQFYVFELVDADTATGCVYLTETLTGEESDCYPLTGRRVSAP